MKTYLAIILIAVAGGAAFFLARPSTPGASEVHRVQLTENGFQPEPLTIQQGDTVEFRTGRGKPFWPASDLHPTHTIYPKFDPREPIEPGETWSFRFDKTGQWRYHDHLAPLFRGTIIVGESERKAPSADCGGVGDAAERQQCWEQRLWSTLDERGVAAAFELVAEASRSEPEFRDCHGLVHEIGERAYYAFSKTRAIELTPTTAYCGYGFYHGFMETLLQNGGTAKDAQDFCAYVDSRLTKSAQGAANACFHGIGHGAVDGGDPNAWGDPQKMIAPALKLCERVASRDMERYLCATGAYNSLEVLARDAQYKLGGLLREPFAFCAGEPPPYREPCYTNMIPAVLSLVNQDILAAARYAEERIASPEDKTIDGYSIREMVVLSIAHEFFRLHGSEIDYATEGIVLCRSLSEASRLACVEGLSGGHIKYGEPGREDARWLEFCRWPDLRGDERSACYKYVLTRLRNWYSEERAREICGRIEEKYRQQFCRL
ncbi:MAG: cupredoxin domain-containing protein [bacterium]|nr:cupredoxin domain-containing protein [bacterium]MDZ4296133.1 cupredoxin domain-containing protein [Patescibacteria group bacterium]